MVVYISVIWWCDDINTRWSTWSRKTSYHIAPKRQKVFRRVLLLYWTRAPYIRPQTFCQVCYCCSLWRCLIVPPGDNTGSMCFRENFARACFEALLQFSFISSKESNIGEHYEMLPRIYNFCKFCCCHLDMMKSPQNLKYLFPPKFSDILNFCCLDMLAS